MMNSLLTLKEQRRVVNIELVVPDSTARRRHGRDTIPVPIFTITIRALVFLDPHKSASLKQHIDQFIRFCKNEKKRKEGSTF